MGECAGNVVSAPSEYLIDADGRMSLLTGVGSASAGDELCGLSVDRPLSQPTSSGEVPDVVGAPEGARE